MTKNEQLGLLAEKISDSEKSEEFETYSQVYLFIYEMIDSIQRVTKTNLTEKDVDHLIGIIWIRTMKKRGVCENNRANN